jgi:hypothetical protein
LLQLPLRKSFGRTPQKPMDLLNTQSLALRFNDLTVQLFNFTPLRVALRRFAVSRKIRIRK